MSAANPVRSLLMFFMLLAGSVSAEPQQSNDLQRLLNQPNPVINKPIKTELQDSATSPDGQWVIERYFLLYRDDNDYALSLHHPQKTPVTNPVFIPFKSGGAAFRWLDNSTLLLAAPEGEKLDTSLSEYYGIHLQYGHYPEDPDVPRIAGAQRVYKKTVKFIYQFGRGTKEEHPDFNCNLEMSTRDGEYLSDLWLMLRVTKDYPNDDLKQLPNNYAYDVLRNPGKAIRPLTSYTGLKVEDVLMGKSIRNKDDLISLIHKILKGDLHVNVGFWLDNAEVIYTNAIPKDQTAITAFEQCISESPIRTSKVEQ